MALLSYIYEGSQITVNPHYYIYEVELWRISKNRANIIKSKLYRSNKFLKVKDIEILREYETFTIERWITLLEAPIEFIKENNLQIYNKKSKRNEKRKSRVSY